MQLTLIDLKNPRRAVAGLAAVFFAGILSGPPGRTQEVSTQSEVLFRVRVSSTGLQAQWRAEGNQPGDFVETRHPGRLYDPPLHFAPIARSEARRDTPLNAAVSDFSAFKVDDDAWILENFSPEQRDGIRQFLGNPDIREQNRKVFEGRSELLITGEVNYEEYVLVFAGSDDGTPVRPLAWKKIGGGSEWLRTNELSGDATFDIVFSALVNGEVSLVE